MSKNNHGYRTGRLKTSVKTAKGRKISSTRWLERQLNDPYVVQAKIDGYRARSAYKLIEMDDRYHFLKVGACIVDLGCAPGGWLQVAVQRSKALENKGFVMGIDIQDVVSVPGTMVMKLDFLESKAPDMIRHSISRPVNVVLSDMVAPVTGHKSTDHLRMIALVESAAWFAFETLATGGTFCAKVFQGGTEDNLLKQLKKHFSQIVHIKPKASRRESVELYVLGLGFKKRM